MVSILFCFVSITFLLSAPSSRPVFLPHLYFISLASPPPFSLLPTSPPAISPPFSLLSSSSFVFTLLLSPFPPSSYSPPFLLSFCSLFPSLSAFSSGPGKSAGAAGTWSFGERPTYRASSSGAFTTSHLGLF